MSRAQFQRPLLRCLQLAVLFLHGGLHAGPYSAGRDDPAKADAPIPGFVGPHGDGAARLETGFETYLNEANYVNPLFFAWAELVEDYTPGPNAAGAWTDPAFALGPVTGDEFEIVSLGDLPGGGLPGTLTLRFAREIKNLTGADFTVFENAFLLGAGGGTIFGELAYVEASADGVNFVRFPSRSLTAAPVLAFGIIDPTNVRNLAGKHVNAHGESWGTPFDLADVGLASVSFIRLVDIPGSGAFFDSLGQPIYDPWVTNGSGGADIEAVGAISVSTSFATWPHLAALDEIERGPDADPNRNGLPNLLEYAFSRSPDRSDSAAPVQCEILADRLALTFTRDERATDLTYEVQARDSLTAGAWTTIARSTAGQPLTGVAGFAPTITESSASPIASVGVVRKVRVADVQTVAGRARRFLRVKVTAATP